MWKNLHCVVCGKVVLSVVSVILFKERSSPVVSWDREPLCPRPIPSPITSWDPLACSMQTSLLLSTTRAESVHNKVKRKTRCEAICQSQTISSLSRSSLLSMIVHVWLMRMRYWDRTEIRNADRVKQLRLPYLDGVVMALRLKTMASLLKNRQQGVDWGVASRTVWSLEFYFIAGSLESAYQLLRGVHSILSQEMLAVLW